MSESGSALRRTSAFERSAAAAEEGRRGRAVQARAYEVAREIVASLDDGLDSPAMAALTKEGVPTWALAWQLRWLFLNRFASEVGRRRGAGRCAAYGPHREITRGVWLSSKSQGMSRAAIARAAKMRAEKRGLRVVAELRTVELWIKEFEKEDDSRASE